MEHGCRLWSTDLIGQVMYACLIMHNMIIRHHKETNPGHLAEEMEEDMFDTPPVLERRNRPTTPSNDLDDLYESNPAFSSSKHKEELQDALVAFMSEQD